MAKTPTPVKATLAAKAANTVTKTVTKAKATVAKAKPSQKYKNEKEKLKIQKQKQKLKDQSKRSGSSLDRTAQLRELKKMIGITGLEGMATVISPFITNTITSALQSGRMTKGEAESLIRNEINKQKSQEKDEQSMRDNSQSNGSSDFMGMFK